GVMAVTEQEWLACTDPPVKMLEFLQDKASVRKQGLFAVACCRGIWHLMDAPSKQAVEVAERYADGNATDAELASARAEASVVPSSLVATSAAVAAWLSTVKGAGAAWRMTGRTVSRASGEQQDRHRAALLHCLFGNPFRPAPVIEPAVLAW